MRDLSKYQGIFPAFYACYDKDGRRQGAVCRRLLRRVHLPERGRAEGDPGERHGRGGRQADRHRPCGLQQHRRQPGAGRPRRKPGSGRHRRHPAHLLPPAPQGHRQILERHLRRRPRHRLCNLQYPPAGGGCPDGASASGDAEKSPGDRCEELVHARPGYSDVARRGGPGVQRAR